MNINYRFATAVLVFLCCMSCNQEETNEQEVQQLRTDLDTEQLLLQETSILLGKVLSRPEHRRVLTKKMSEATIYRDMISLGALFDVEEGKTKDEIKFAELNSAKSNTSASEILEDISLELLNSRDEYPVLESNLKLSNIITKSGTVDNMDLATELAEQDLMLFNPSGLESDDGELMITYSLENSYTNEVIGFDDGTQTGILPDKDNDFLDEEPVLVVVPIDPCDQPDNPCGYVDLLPLPTKEDLMLINNGDLSITEAEDVFYDIDQVNEGNWDSYTFNQGFDESSGPIPDPLPNDEPILLTDDYNHADFPQEDLVRVVIPRIKIEGLNYMGFGGTHQKLTFARGTEGGIPSVDSSGNIKVPGKPFIINDDFRTRRKYLKRKLRWLSFNVVFDNDWDLSEASQQLVVFSRHHISAEAEATLGFKAGYKLEGDTIKPSSSGEIAGKVTIKKGSAIFRAHEELTRKYIFANNVGPDVVSGLPPKEDDGVDYTRMKVGIIHFYTKIYWRDFE